MKFFNKTSTGFLVRFTLILLLSFAILFAVDFYLSGADSQDDVRATAPLDR